MELVPTGGLRERADDAAAQPTGVRTAGERHRPVVHLEPHRVQRDDGRICGNVGRESSPAASPPPTRRASGRSGSRRQPATIRSSGSCDPAAPVAGPRPRCSSLIATAAAAMPRLLDVPTHVAPFESPSVSRTATGTPDAHLRSHPDAPIAEIWRWRWESNPRPGFCRPLPETTRLRHQNRTTLQERARGTRPNRDDQPLRARVPTLAACIRHLDHAASCSSPRSCSSGPAAPTPNPMPTQP